MYLVIANVMLWILTALWTVVLYVPKYRKKMYVDFNLEHFILGELINILDYSDNEKPLMKALAATIGLGVFVFAGFVVSALIAILFPLTSLIAIVTLIYYKKQKQKL